MIPISGMSSYLGLRLVDTTQDYQKQRIQEAPQNARAIKTFLERVEDIETVDQFIEDTEIYTFVMRAFNLEDQIFGKAMISKILKSDIEDDEALVNKLTDARFREMYNELGFQQGGVGNINTLLKTWQKDMVNRFVDTLFVNEQTDQNETVGAALEFRRKASLVEGPFDILKDVDMAIFMRTVLGLPDEMVQLDVDRQAKIIESKYDLEKLKDPEEVERLISRFVIISDALNSTNTANNAAVQLMNGAVNARNSDNFVAITIDITGISAFRGGY